MARPSATAPKRLPGRVSRAALNVGKGVTMTMEDSVRLDDGLRSLAAMLVGAEPLEATLERVTAIAARALGAGAGVSITLAPGGMHTAAASTPKVCELDAVQYRTGDGPCLEAIRTGRVHLSRPDDGTFAAFRAAAGEAGCAVTVIGLPVHVGETTIGAMNVYAADGARLDDGVLEAAESLAAHVAVALANARSYEECQTRVAQLQEALDSRVVIEQAKGVLMAQHRCDAERAFRSLRERSQKENRKLRAVAGDVVASVAPA